MKYYLTTEINDKALCFMKELEDPFVSSFTYISRWDRFKSLFKKELKITVRVIGDKEAIFKVMSDG